MASGSVLAGFLLKKFEILQAICLWRFHLKLLSKNINQQSCIPRVLKSFIFRSKFFYEGFKKSEGERVKNFVKISGKYLELLSLRCKSNPGLLTAPFPHFSSALIPADSFHTALAPANKTKIKK